MKIKRSEYLLFFVKDTAQIGPASKLIKGGFINQQASGVYTYLHLGLRSLEKIQSIIDEELHKINAVKILAPMCHNSEIWKTSNRYEEFGSEMLKMKDRNNKEFVFGPTSEEIFTSLLTKFSMNQKSYPLILYNNQWKFRDEIRPRFGVVRCREFLMNDAYSFDETVEGLTNSYKKFYSVYSRIFSKLNINICTMPADVGLMGGLISHEFLTPSTQGESKVKYSKWPSQPIQWEERDYIQESSEGDETFCELGHIYALGDKYTKIFNLKHPRSGKHLYMGCYGIGISRILGHMCEKEDLGIIAPYSKILISFKTEESEIVNRIYNYFDDICWDDRDESAGSKYAEADLMLAPMQIHIGRKEIENNQIIVKEKGVKTIYTTEEFFNIYKNI